MVHVQFSLLVPQCVVLYVLVHLLLLRLRHMSRLLPQLGFREVGSPHHQLAVGAQLLHHNLAVVFEDVCAFHLGLVSAHDDALVMEDTEGDNNLQVLVDLNSLYFVIFEEEIVEQVADLAEILLSLPDVALEDEEGTHLERHVDALTDLGGGLQVVQSEFDHVEHFAIIGSPNDYIVGPLLVMGAEQEQTGVSLAAEVLHVLMVLKGQDLVLAGVEHTAVAAEGSLGYGIYTISLRKVNTGSEVLVPLMSMVFLTPSMSLGSRFRI